MAPKTATIDFKQRKTRSSSLATPKKKNVITEENVAPNSEVKLPRRNARIIKDTKLRGVSPVKSPIKKRSTEILSSPLKSIQLNRVVSSPKKVSAKTKLFDENTKANTTPQKSTRVVLSPKKNSVKDTKDTKLHGVSPVKSPIKKRSTEILSSPLKSIQLNRVVFSPKKASVNAKLIDENSKNNTTPQKSQ